MDTTNIGNFLCELRKQKNLTQRELADILYVSDKAISRWETGKGIPEIESLQSLSNYFQVSINEILAGKHIKEDEMKTTTDQNAKKLIKREMTLRKKLYISLTAFIILLALFLLSITTTSPILTNGACFSNSVDEIELAWDYVENLVSQNKDYTVQMDPATRTIYIFYEEKFTLRK